MGAEGVAAFGSTVPGAKGGILVVGAMRITAEGGAIVRTTDRVLGMRALAVSAGSWAVFGAGVSALFTLAGPVATGR